MFECIKLRLVHFYKHCFPYYHVTGLLELTISDICFNLGLVEEGQEHCKNAYKILQVNFGTDHPVVTKIWKPVFEKVELMKKLEARRQAMAKACRPWDYE